MSLFDPVRAAAHPGFTTAKAPVYPHPTAKKKPPPVPWWMQGPAALQALALKQAHAQYDPALSQLGTERDRAAAEAKAKLLGIERLLSVVSSIAQGIGAPQQAAYQNAANTDFGGSPLAGQAKEMFQKEGDAYSGIGNAYAGDAANSGEAQFLNVVQDSNKVAQSYADQIAETRAKIPGAAQEIYGGLSSDAFKYRTAQQAAQDKYRAQQAAEYRDAYNRAFQTAKYYTDKTGELYIVADTPEGPQLVKARDKKGNPISTVGLTPYQKAEIQQRAQASKAQAVAAANKPPPQRQNPDGSYSIFVPGTGWVKDPSFNPSKPKKVVKTKARVILSEAGTPLSNSDIKTYTDDVHGLMGTIKALPDLIETLKNSPVPAAIWKPIVARRYRVPIWAVKGTAPNIAGLRMMTPKRLYQIAVFLGYDGPVISFPLGAGSVPTASKQELIGFIMNHSITGRTPAPVAVPHPNF